MAQALEQLQTDERPERKQHGAQKCIRDYSSLLVLSLFILPLCDIPGQAIPLHTTTSPPPTLWAIFGYGYHSAVNGVKPFQDSEPYSKYFNAIYNILRKQKYPEGVDQFNPFSSHTVESNEPADSSLHEGFEADDDHTPESSGIKIEVVDFSSVKNIDENSVHAKLLLRLLYHEFRQHVKEVTTETGGLFYTILLLGCLGIGKTVLLFIMLYWCIEENVPVYYQPRQGWI
ncbi:hypothetical protein DFP72DRAFT_846424 [Ephemerocybe angulata]|uniref:Uncharacterized protein n=1 Tax=Ephemerocybe angulata TaxID=980116 RepID=A0A8H6I0L7_9AGAR|nr:hypothetical protein DFP72DRAFT_846424 [Tulosesus angulatus]